MPILNRKIAPETRSPTGRVARLCVNRRRSREACLLRGANSQRIDHPHIGGAVPSVVWLHLASTPAIQVQVRLLHERPARVIDKLDPLTLGPATRAECPRAWS